MAKRNGASIAEVNQEKRDRQVNHPAHYGGEDNVYEVIKVCEAWGVMTNAYRFTTIKYLARAGKKDDLLQDLQKARWYLNREIEQLEGAKQPGDTERPDPRDLWVVVNETGPVMEFGAPFDAATKEEAAVKAFVQFGTWHPTWLIVPATPDLLEQFPEAE